MESLPQNNWPDLYELELQTERLAMRFPRLEEEELVVDLTFDAAHTVDENGRGFTEGMMWDPPSHIDETREFMERSKQLWNDGNLGMAIFIDKTTPIGRCVIRLGGNKVDTWEIGYWMHPDFQGKGYMTEVATELVRFGFEELYAEKLIASAARWNEASQRVIQKSGMQLIPPQDDHGVTKNGVFVPQFRYELTKDSYKTDVHKRASS